MKPAERRDVRTHKVTHITTRVLRNIEDGFCEVLAARIRYGKDSSVKFRFIPKLRFDRSTAVDAA